MPGSPLSFLLTGAVRRSLDAILPALERVGVPWTRGAREGSAVFAVRPEALAATAAALEGCGAEDAAGALRAITRPVQGAFRLGEVVFDLARGPFVMGIINVTPDSFSDGGEALATEAAVARAEALIAEGAHLLDIGGESTRPGAAAVSVEEELSRVLPVIETVARRFPQVPISIDTSKAPVALEAVAAGACLVNDVTGLAGDIAMSAAVAKSGAALCVMHMRGTPRTMQNNPSYFDVVEEVLESLSFSVRAAVEAGVAPERIMIDPGIAFGKLPEHSLYLMRRLADFRALGRPVLVGSSRKSVWGHVSGKSRAADRVIESVAHAGIVAAQHQADFIRVHDVKATTEAIAVGRALRTAKAGGLLFQG